MPYNSPAFSYQGEYFKKTVLLEMTLGWISHTIKSWVTYRTVPKLFQTFPPVCGI